MIELGEEHETGGSHYGLYSFPKYLPPLLRCFPLVLQAVIAVHDTRPSRRWWKNDGDDSGAIGERRRRPIGIMANGAVESRGDVVEGARGVPSDTRSGIVVDD